MCCDCDDCRPLGFVIGLPFMLIGLVLSLLGMIIWILATILPCCFCCAGIASVALALIKAPINIIRWFTKQIPC